MVIPICQIMARVLKVNSIGNILNYPTLQSTGTTKILGLRVSRCSFSSAHIKTASSKAKNILTKCYSLQGLDTEVKIILYKMLIMPILTYPVMPLNTAPKRSMVTLQRDQNKALAFIYHSRWPNSLFQNSSPACYIGTHQSSHP